MGLFRKRPAAAVTTAPTLAESLQGLVQSAGQPSLFAHSEFVKQVSCPACGAPKRLPSKTAYLYCDHCGALVDYDFRLARGQCWPGGRPSGTPRWPAAPVLRHGALATRNGPAGEAGPAGPS